MPAPKKTEAAADKVEVAKAGPGEEIVTVDAGDPAASTAGATPMNKRIAVLGLLNKRNGQARDVTLSRAGQATRIGEVILAYAPAMKTTPWETEQYTGAFAQLESDGK